jgi:YesN/AraC family two-component response regulator
MMQSIPFVRSQSLHVDFKDIVIDQQESLVHYHDACEIAFFERADIELYLNDRFYVIEDGDVMFLQEYDSHRIHYKQGEAYTRYVLNFSKACIERYLDAMEMDHIWGQLNRGLDGKVRITNREQREAMRTLFSFLWSLSQTSLESSHKELMMRWNTCSLLFLISTLQEKKQCAKLPMKAQTVQSVMTFIDECYREEITLKSIAEHFHLSKYYLGHLFKETTQMTVIGYIHFRRVSEAKKLFKKNPASSVLDVSMECGFNNVQHFHRVFKKLTKQTPYQYKRLT